MNLASPYLLLVEASALARTPSRSLREHIAKGAIRAFRPGKSILVERSSLLAWIARSPVGDAPPADARGGEEPTPAFPPPSARETLAASREVRRGRRAEQRAAKGAK